MGSGRRVPSLSYHVIRPCPSLMGRLLRNFHCGGPIGTVRSENSAECCKMDSARPICLISAKLFKAKRSMYSIDFTKTCLIPFDLTSVD